MKFTTPGTPPISWPGGATSCILATGEQQRIPSSSPFEPRSKSSPSRSGRLRTCSPRSSRTSASKEYETFVELLDYCRRSADPVGRIVLYLCRAHSERNAAWSDSICTGLQLANFWQDVARDSDMGRVYLPRESRRRFGYSDADLANRVTNEAFLELMNFEVAMARQLLTNGLPLVKVLPWPLCVDIDLFARGGLCLLDRIERIGYRVWQRRPVLTKMDFARLFIGSLGRGLLRLPRRPAI